MASSNNYLGKGARDGDNIECVVFGEPFPFSCPGGFGANDDPLTIIDEAVTFNLSGISENQEVCVSITNITLQSGEDKTYAIKHEWFRDDGGSWTSIFTYGPWDFHDVCVSGPCSFWRIYSYIGWASWEINKNGNYKIVFTFTGDITGTVVIEFTITGIPERIPGYLWIEGEDLHWIDENGSERIAANLLWQGGGQGADPGYIWIGSDLVFWTDENGDVRRIGERVQVGSSGTKTPGYIWIEGVNFHYITDGGTEFRCAPAP